MVVLIVDDERDLATTCARLVRRLGHSVETADSHAAARARLSANPPAVLVCDVRLPDGDGLDLVRRSRPIPAIVMTGHPSERGRADALAAGACAYLSKPFGVERFADVVRRALDAAGATPAAP